MRRSIDWVLVRLAIAVALALAVPIGGVATARRLDDRPHLRGELERVIAVVDATGAAVATGRERSFWTADADPASADDPNSSEANLNGMTPGYVKCDGSWRDRLLPGWQAGYGHTYVLADRADGDALVLATSDYWRGLGYDVAIEHWRDASRVNADLAHGTIMMTVSSSTPMRVAGTRYPIDHATLDGFTDCLPTG